MKLKLVNIEIINLISIGNQTLVHRINLTNYDIF